jgi:hypothetical protein
MFLLFADTRVRFASGVDLVDKHQKYPRLSTAKDLKNVAALPVAVKAQSMIMACLENCGNDDRRARIGSQNGGR